MCFFCWVFCIQLAGSYLQASEKPIKSFSSYISKGGYALQIDRDVVRASNIDSSFIPASAIKVLTGLMAIEILGPHHRFTTRFFIDERNVLFIQGEGDPFLTSEAIVDIAHELKKRNIQSIESIVLDDTAFALEAPPPDSTNSRNPYDAPSGALAVNFNSIPFIVTQSRKVISGEPQTPYLPLMKEIAGEFQKGSYRVNVSAFPPSQYYSNMLRYSGELFYTLFKQQGIELVNGYTVGKTHINARSLLVYESEKTVSELVHECLYYSNNYIANQLYLSCGRKMFGFPATWKKAGKMAEEYMQLKLQLTKDDIKMVDGSGLSPRNRITPDAMLKVLNLFKPYATLLKKTKDTFIKSGTLEDVYCYVGYFEDNQKLSPFVLFLNQKRNNRKILLNLMHNEFKTQIRHP